MSVIEDIQTLRARLGQQGTQVLTLKAITFQLGSEQLNIGVGMDVTLLAEGAGATLDAGGLSRVIQVNGGRLVVNGIALVGGTQPDGFGGCLRVMGSADVSLSNLQITGCSARRGGGVHVEDSTLSMVNVEVSDAIAASTTTDVRGGGVYVESGDVTLLNSSLTNVRAVGSVPDKWASGGALHVRGGNVEVADSSIADAIATATGRVEGGALTIYGGSVRLSGLNVTNGEARSVNAEATGAGGCAFISGANVSLTASTLTGCHASTEGANSWAQAGGIGVRLGSVLHINETTISDCSLQSPLAAQGGGIEVLAGAQINAANLLVSNVMLNAGNSGFGGGLLTGAGTKGIISDSEIRNVTIVATLQALGGGIDVVSADLNILNTTIMHSQLEAVAAGSRAEGGGVAVVNEANVSIIDSTVEHNSASGDGRVGGGGVFIDGAQDSTVLISGTRISDCNTSGDGGGLGVGGGTVTMTNHSLLANNKAEGNGDNFHATGGTTFYQLPTPLGHWIPGQECIVLRENCELRSNGLPVDSRCPLTRDACSRVTGAIVNGTGIRPSVLAPDGSTIECRPSLRVQPCDWGGFPGLIGQITEVLPFAGIDETYPYECAQGRRSSFLPEDQSSARCAGQCTGDLAAPDVCNECPPGHFCATGKAAPCPRGTHANDAPPEERNSLAACKLCPGDLGFTTTIDVGTANVSGCVCERGLLTDPTRPPNTSLRCIEQPEHLSNDERDTRMADLIVEQGYWRPGYLTKTARLCPMPDLCASNTTADPVYDRFGDSSCTPGRGVAGAFCLLCMNPDQYYSTNEQKCTSCSADETIPEVAVLLAMGILIVATVAAPLPYRRLSELRDRFGLYAARISFRSKLRETIAFVQVITQIASVYDLRFPQAYETLLEVMSIVNVSFLGWMPAIQLFCFGLRTLTARLVFATWVPLGVAGVAPLVTKYTRGSALAALPFVVIWTFLLFPAISSSGFRALAACDCFELVDGSYECFLPADYEVQCEGNYFGIQGAPPDVLLAAWMAIIIWSIGVPLFYAGLIIAAQRNTIFGYAIEGRDLGKKIRLLISGYRKGAVGWQLVMVLQRLVLTGYLALYRPGTFSQLGIANIVILIFFTLQARVAPHRAPSDNLFCFLASCMLQIVFVLSAALQAQALAPNLNVNIYTVAVLLFIATLFVVVIAAWLFALEAYASRQVLEIESTRQPPKLELAPGKKFHIFLSHRWDNQDAVATIKRQLQLLLPGVEVFLDIDDLESTDLIEAYVEASAAVLVLLGSTSYFKSTNCLRELAAAKQHALPIVAVHEQDVSKGGAMLDELKIACPPEYQDLIFAANRPVITWIRARELQLLSIAKIGERLLLASPDYATLTELPLRVPRALAWERPFFDAPLSLYVSQHNPEAEAVAEALQAHYSDGQAFNSHVLLAEGSSAGASRWAHVQAVGHTRAWGMVLYLTTGMFEGESGRQLADELHAALLYGARPVLVYDADASEFGDFIDEAPQRLKTAGLFKPLAVEWRAEPHRTLSVRLVAKALGAHLGHGCGSRATERAISVASSLRASMTLSTIEKLVRTSRQSSRKEEQPGSHLITRGGLVVVPPSDRLPPQSSKRRISGQEQMTMSDGATDHVHDRL